MPGKENKVQKSSQSNDVYIVEEVVKKKKDALTGKNLYLVKWIGFSSDENTWEPEESFQDDGQSIAEFEERVKEERQKLAKKRKQSRVPETIIGMTPDLGKSIKVLVRFDNDDYELITNEEARQMCPQLLISYYEAHVELLDEIEDKISIPKIKKEPIDMKVSKKIKQEPV